MKIKNKNIMNTIIKLSLLSLTYFAAIKTLFHLMIALVIIDLFTGVWKSVKVGGWKSIKSRLLKRTVIKTTCYIIALVVSYLFESIIIGTNGVITNIVAGMIGITEVASIFENLTTITGNSLFMKLFDVLKTYFNTNKNIIDNLPGVGDDKEMK
jgi:phage-related holin